MELVVGETDHARRARPRHCLTRRLSREVIARRGKSLEVFGGFTNQSVEWPATSCKRADLG